MEWSVRRVDDRLCLSRESSLSIFYDWNQPSNRPLISVLVTTSCGTAHSKTARNQPVVLEPF